MNYLSKILATLSLAFLGGVLVAQAETTDALGYIPLVTIPGVTNAETGAPVELGSYLVNMMRFLIAASGALAIVMLVVAGTKYVAAGIAPDAKNDAKHQITNALIGLGLVLTSYLILNTINPNLVNFNLSLKSVGEVRQDRVEATPGASWPNDDTVRSVLEAAGIIVTGTGTPNPCSSVGQSFCTSVYGLPARAVTGLIGLKNACPTCSVVVTGGTEYWAHKTHGAPGTFMPIVDIDNADPRLNALIRDGRTPINPEGGCGLRKAPHYHITDTPYAGIYVDEGSHWHVCY